MMSIVPPPTITKDTFLEKFGLRNSNSANKIVGKNNEIKSDCVAKLTHLFMNGKHITSIGDLSPCQNLKVLYLHNNDIEKIDNLSKLRHLTHLYLQWNKIGKIENLGALRKLKKLYLGNNEIKRLENLEKLTQLEELHVEHQRLLDDGECDNNNRIEFSFDLNCLNGIGKTLKVLNVSGLHLTDLSSLETLYNLEEIIATENDFNCATKIGQDLSVLMGLKRVKVHHCPAQKDIHYREKITAGAHQIEILDDKNISGHTRYFIKKFEAIKAARREQTRVGSVNSTLSSTKDDKSSNGNTVQKQLVTNNVPQLGLLIQPLNEITYQPWNSLNPTNFHIKKPSPISTLHQSPFGKKKSGALARQSNDRSDTTNGSMKVARQVIDTSFDGLSPPF